jgi:hypothetical protein
MGSDTGTLQQISELCIPRKGIARGLSSNFHIDVSVSYLFIPTIGPPIFLPQKYWQADRGNI